jgi:signal transduction histidine kinase
MKTRAPWVLLAAGAAMAGAVIWISLLNGSFSEDGPFIAIALVSMTGWATVGAILASRNPANAIGWLMMTFGIGFAFAGLVSEWTTYAYVTNPGGLPFRAALLSLSNWSFLAVIITIPITLVLYPTGHVRSPRWRPLLWALVLIAIVGAVGTAIKPGLIEVTAGVQVPNPTGVEGLAGLARILQTVGGIGYTVVLIPLCIAAVIVRFRGSSGEERQQIRWLAYITGLGGVAFGVALVSGIGLSSNETNLVNEISFYVFAFAVGLGVPVAIGVALLKYRLWDLEIVVKKTLVAAIVVTLVAGLSLVALVLVSTVVIDRFHRGQAGAHTLAGVVIGVLLWPMLRLARRLADRLVYGRRATPYEVLTEFSERMADTYSTDDVLPRMASILGAGAGAEAVTIWLLVGGELRSAAEWPTHGRSEEPISLPAFAVARHGTFEVRHQGELLGAITVVMPANDPMTPSKERLIRDLASQAGLVLRNVRLIEELRDSRRRIVAAVDEGRRRLERNIHDGAQQQLVALAVKLRLTEGALERDPAKARELIAQLQTEANDALEALRNLARGIYPPLLADQGLTAALEAQARKSPVPVRVAPDGIGRYAQDVEASVYFCVLEALQNVAKYASASHVDVELRQDGGRLAFEVRDDGIGFDPSAAPRGTGLQGMADRIDAVGGTFALRSTPGHGTTVAGSIPVPTT